MFYHVLSCCLQHFTTTLALHFIAILCGKVTAGLNHFVPAFPMNVVPGLVLQEQADRFTQEMKQIAVEKAKTLKAWLDAEQKHDGSTDIDMIEAVFNSKTTELQERREQIKSFQKLLGEAQAKGFALFEVPADGNCAVHGLCNLLSGTPGNGSPPAVVAAVREEIAQAWEKATEDSNWTEVFEKLVAVFDPDPEPAKASKAKKEVKMEQTPQRSQRGAVFFVGQQGNDKLYYVIIRYIKVQNFRRV